MAHNTDTRAEPDLSHDRERASSPRQDAQGTCCGGAAPKGSDACCALDAVVKSAGGSGCGCSTQPPAATKKKGCC